ncbi:uncharacterized protein N7458_002566 [Penicillium daleae]|uniref:Glycosyl transferase CAP10 domain-containing protein n=1 Tax=Penicillium daleae TaxID=63821 RepID=A0AAD6CDR9_9EURO|nr:uncharacterized protein N7458_002566 [Penicillium daleae]KAJ5461014.1 hypothetical protein N7458_002566 [Penicillium daleae]
MLTSFYRLLMALSRALENGLEALRRVPGDYQPYPLLEEVRGKSMYFYSRMTKSAWLLTRITLVLVIMYLVTATPLAGTLQQAYIIRDERFCDHPVTQLAYNAQKMFNRTWDRQSQSLDKAVAEYRRRYQMPPPPYFDKWYQFATERNTMLIDEFDNIYHAILPFWGLAPSKIRARVREDLGHPNVQMEVAIHHGLPIHKNGGQGNFQEHGTIESLRKFAQWLPNMNLGFNAHDEPRVVVPHEELNRLVLKGRKAHARLSGREVALRSYFTQLKLEEPVPVHFNRFIDIEKQETWLYSRLSCPPDSPAMSQDDTPEDNTTSWALKPLGFIYNQTAASDMCLSPSLQHRLGVYEHPNAFKITNEMTPMFSMSRPSSFQDITVPSPYYYDSVTDFDNDTARVIGNLTQPQSPYYVMERQKNSQCNVGGDGGWTVRNITHNEIKNYFNAHFTVIQVCDDDCEEENEFFNDLVKPDPQEEAWRYRYLLDMDGHAYSGRFYAFMRSQSVPFKLTFFREWHENVLFPWVHYVPINKDANEIPELVRFFEQDPEGKRIAKSIGVGGQEWARKTLRKEDMDVYLFRLLLEYARVQDDNREILGYSRACSGQV